MATKLSSTARHIYDSCAIPKILLANKPSENNDALEVKNMSQSSVPSFESKHSSSKREKVSQHNILQLTLLQNFQRMQKQYQKNKFSPQANLDELQRIVFLRFVMAFGLQSQKKSNLFFQKLIAFDKGAFQTENEAQLKAQLKNYMKQFLTIIYSQMHPTQIPKETIRHYCFSLQPRQILQRIIVVNQMRKVYEKYREDAADKSKKLEKDGFVLSFELQLMIFEAIQHRGFGRWESVSEYSKIWEPNTERMSLREYFCKKVELYISTQIFTKFLNDRMTCLVQKFKQADFLL